jgi:hypothetical protein
MVPGLFGFRQSTELLGSSWSSSPAGVAILLPMLDLDIRARTSVLSHYVRSTLGLRFATALDVTL